MLLSAEALVIVTLHLEQLLEVHLAVGLALQSSIGPSAVRGGEGRGGGGEGRGEEGRGGEGRGEG